MAANLEFRFDFIAPNSSAGVFIHGYGNREAVAYSAVVFPGSGAGVPNPLGKVNMTLGETLRHVDGTIGRTVNVQNLAPFNSCTVDILILRESF
jgi:hypothetical protein